MNSIPSIPAPSHAMPDADRIGVAASVLCAIHCALAPVLLIALPSFGRIWAHPASHILVALFVVPLAALSIRKGYRIHRKRWVVAVAVIGIILVLGGAALPAFGKEINTDSSVSNSETVSSADTVCSSSCENSADTSESSSDTGCVDACCPSLQVSETGETSLHIPPAAIVTTLGGLFLIAAHIGNLCFCGHACRTEACNSCA